MEKFIGLNSLFRLLTPNETGAHTKRYENSRLLIREHVPIEIRRQKKLPAKAKASRYDAFTFAGRYNYFAVRLQLYLLLRSLALIAETVESGHHVSVACTAVYERQLDEFV